MTTPEEINQAIDSIIESAVRWNSDDADNPDTPPEAWQKAIPLLRTAPKLLWVARYLISSLIESDRTKTIRQLDDAWNEFRRIVAEATGDDCNPPDSLGACIALYGVADAVALKRMAEVVYREGYAEGFIAGETNHPFDANKSWLKSKAMEAV